MTMKAMTACGLAAASLMLAAGLASGSASAEDVTLKMAVPDWPPTHIMKDLFNRQSVRLLTGRFQVRVLAREPRKRHRRPSCLRQRRKRGNPHGAGSARGRQDPHKIPTTCPRQARTGDWAGMGRAGPLGRVLANGTGRAATRGGGEVIELEYGITVYPARDEHGRWRAV